ncbi:MAG: MaoC/PaaZ C-terminal domain-containing protein [Pseudomonadota bacterium]
MMILDGDRMAIVDTASDFRKRLQNYAFPEVAQSYTTKDCILYALGIGFGEDPTHRAELPFVFEEPNLQVVPSMAAVLASPGFWARDPATGIDWHRFLHAEQEVILHRPLPTDALVRAKTRITRIIDKGESKGALIYLERDIADQFGALATVKVVNFARRNGGCGGDSGPQPAPHTMPADPPEARFETHTDPRSALFYRLSGDPNPLHVDPDVASAAGFERPILHGLCSFGIATRAILATYCDYQPGRLRSIKLRFSRPVYPGETIRVEMWRDGPEISFRATVADRGVTALDHGCAKID